MDDQEEYNGASDNLLDDFESEMMEEDRLRVKRRKLVIGGILAGAALWFFLSSGGDDLPENQQEAKPAVTESEEARQDDIDIQIARLNEQNRIDEDFKAPGSLMENRPMEPAIADTKPEAEQPEEITPAEKEAEIDGETKESGVEEKTATEEITASTEPAEEKATQAEEAPEKIATLILSKKPEKTDPYTVQVSATMDALAALEQRDQLLKKGFDSWIFMGKSKQLIYRVESGEFKSIQEASTLSAGLAQAGFVNRTTYIKKGSRVTLVTGSSEDKKKASRLNKRLSSAGFPSRITTSPDVQTLYIVRVGKFKALQEARNAKTALGRAGIATLGITQ